MRFSIFDQPLNKWQGKSLIFGVFQNDIKKKLEIINFIVNPKTISQKIEHRKFNGEKGQTLKLDFIDKNVQSICFIGLGDIKNYDRENLLLQGSSEVSAKTDLHPPLIGNQSTV